MERVNFSEVWETVGYPGYLGKKRDEKYREWNNKYGEGNWRIVNLMANGEIFSYEDIIFRIYIPGYEAYFSKHFDEAKFITDNYSFAYDKDVINKHQAYEIYALYNKPGVSNQFHHVAFNLALQNLGFRFKGNKPLQVREGRPGTPESKQPEGYKWSPGRIPCVNPELIPPAELSRWWELGSIEAAYQESKVLQKRVK